MKSQVEASGSSELKVGQRISYPGHVIDGAVIIAVGRGHLDQPTPGKLLIKYSRFNDQLRDLVTHAQDELMLRNSLGMKSYPFLEDRCAEVWNG